MRTSGRQTTVAVLRATISDLIRPLKLDADEFAEMCGRKVDAVRSVECGRMPLSEEFAVRIAHETGASVSWLLEGKARARIRDAWRRPYTAETFYRARAKKNERFGRGTLALRTLEYYSVLRRVLLCAHRNGNAHLATYKLWSAIKQAAKEFDSPSTVEIRDGETFKEHAQRILRADLQALQAGVQIITYPGSRLKQSSRRRKRA